MRGDASAQQSDRLSKVNGPDHDRKSESAEIPSFSLDLLVRCAALSRHQRPIRSPKMSSLAAGGSAAAQIGSSLNGQSSQPIVGIIGMGDVSALLASRRKLGPPTREPELSVARLLGLYYAPDTREGIQKLTLSRWAGCTLRDYRRGESRRECCSSRRITPTSSRGSRWRHPRSF